MRRSLTLGRVQNDGSTKSPGVLILLSAKGTRVPSAGESLFARQQPWETPTTASDQGRYLVSEPLTGTPTQRLS